MLSSQFTRDGIDDRIEWKPLWPYPYIFRAWNNKWCKSENISIGKKGPKHKNHSKCTFIIFLNQVRFLLSCSHLVDDEGRPNTLMERMSGRTLNLDRCVRLCRCLHEFLIHSEALMLLKARDQKIQKQRREKNESNERERLFISSNHKMNK